MTVAFPLTRLQVTSPARLNLATSLNLSSLFQTLCLEEGSLQYRLKSSISCETVQAEGFYHRRFNVKSYPLVGLSVPPKTCFVYCCCFIYSLLSYEACLIPVFLSLQHHTKVEYGKLESTFLINTPSNPRL